MTRRTERRAASRRTASPSASHTLKRFYWALGAVAVIGVAAIGYSVGSRNLGRAASEPVTMEGIEDMAALLAAAEGVTMGSPDAPITIMEFSDYQCPSCGYFALSVKPQVELAWIQTGKAKFVFHDLPLISIHPNAFIAARSARCALDQNRFWEYHDALFRNQSSWSADPRAMGKFIEYADAIGMDEDAFEACVDSDKHADVVTAQLHLADALGLSSTPSILVGTTGGTPRRLADFDFPTIRTAMEQLLAAPDPTGTGG